MNLEYLIFNIATTSIKSFAISRTLISIVEYKKIENCDAILSLAGITLAFAAEHFTLFEFENPAYPTTMPILVNAARFAGALVGAYLTKPLLDNPYHIPTPLNPLPFAAYH